MKQFRQTISENLLLSYHSHLNHKLFNLDDKMHDHIRQHLLLIGQTWAKFANIPDEAIVDIIFTGGNANYNWNVLSDLDVHVEVNLNKFMTPDRELLKKSFFHYKDLWALKHPDIKVLGYPVELFAEDYLEYHNPIQGIYSLTKDEWINKPEHFDDVDYENDPYLQDRVNSLKTQIDKLLQDGDEEGLNRLRKEIVAKRRQSIIDEGEIKSKYNAIFKSLRNSGHLNKMTNYFDRLTDTRLSL